MTIEKTLEAVSEKLKDTPINTDYADSLLLIKNALEKQRMCEWTKERMRSVNRHAKPRLCLEKLYGLLCLQISSARGKPCTI